MRPGGGRDKGNAFERKVAKILTEAWKFPIVRTPNSGAFHNLAPADIIPENNKIWLEFPFHLELKCREGWSLEQLLKGSCPVIDWYYEEEKKQVESRGQKFYDKCMLLIFSKNHDDVYIMWREGLGWSEPHSELYGPRIGNYGFLPTINDTFNLRKSIIVLHNPIKQEQVLNTRVKNEIEDVANEIKDVFCIMRLKDFLVEFDYEKNKQSYLERIKDKNHE